jgi:hypothetical protein
MGVTAAWHGVAGNAPHGNASLIPVRLGHKDGGSGHLSAVSRSKVIP